MYVVKDILGHSQISTTTRRTHPTSETIRDAAAEMDVLFPEDQDEKGRKKRENKYLGCKLGCSAVKTRRMSLRVWLSNGAGDGTRTRTDD
jgi:hypothetical protein